MKSRLQDLTTQSHSYLGTHSILKRTTMSDESDCQNVCVFRAINQSIANQTVSSDRIGNRKAIENQQIVNYSQTVRFFQLGRQLTAPLSLESLSPEASSSWNPVILYPILLSITSRGSAFIRRWFAQAASSGLFISRSFFWPSCYRKWKF